MIWCIDRHLLVFNKRPFRALKYLFFQIYQQPTTKITQSLSCWIFVFFLKKISPVLVHFRFILKLRQLSLKMHSLFVDDLQGFQKAINSEIFNIINLHSVMMEAIQLNRVEFVSTLLSRGFPIRSSYAQKAKICKAIGVLECFLKAAWNINEPLDVFKPSVLWYADFNISKKYWNDEMCFVVMQSQIPRWSVGFWSMVRTRMRNAIWIVLHCLTLFEMPL